MAVNTFVISELLLNINKTKKSFKSCAVTTFGTKACNTLFRIRSKVVCKPF